MLTFDNKGNLQGDVLTGYTLADIERYLVAPFPHSTTRRYIFNNLLAFIETLSPDHYSKIWLDGSFCTQKENPNDIDCLVFISPQEESRFQFQRINSEHLVYKNNKLDVYPCFDKELVQTNDEAYPIYQKMQDYWQEMFGNDRAGNPKAIIELKIGDTHD